MTQSTKVQRVDGFKPHLTPSSRYVYVSACSFRVTAEVV